MVICNSKLDYSTLLIWTPVNTDNGHLFLAQSTDSHKKGNLANVGTSLWSMSCKRPFLSEGKKPVDSISMFPAATLHPIGQFVDTSSASNGLVCRERTLLINGSFTLPSIRSLKLAIFHIKLSNLPNSAWSRFVNRIRRKNNSHVDVNV